MNNPLLVLIGTLVLSSIFGAQPAQAKSKLVHKLQMCSQQQNDAQRLSCYDTLAADYASKQHRTRSQAPISPPESFGLEHKKEQDQVISATVSEVSKSANGQRRFTLDNQQRWQQIGTHAFFAKKGDTVIIRRGSFNSFIMLKEGSNRSVKVRRVD
ncbi:hypothetical protein [Pseudoalteromonas sp. OOF1S-7]|uniref:hypothetical protein n=1 Tax=Pseudoalteromonas sp. OOF1S-7 TaxID=2917757 RepID=UPI001EF40575|nr:hypothetical protein [Pseudoalteromonas sp. OOF1S-7]MCG7536042.1 hypothetical protein [Pseudoalteromonas sp. OOF1S-7]